jgi:hypothetical protein
LGDDPGRISQRREHRGRDAQARAGGAPAGQLGPDRGGERARPSRRTRPRSPAARSSATASDACQDADRNGLPEASRTAGQTQSSRSRDCWTPAVASVVSRTRRAPRCRSRAQVASVLSGW